jgi:hypothetical protein
MCTALKSLNVEFKDVDLPELGPCEIGPLTEEKLDETTETNVDISKPHNT